MRFICCSIVLLFAGQILAQDVPVPVPDAVFAYPVAEPEPHRAVKLFAVYLRPIEKESSIVVLDEDRAGMKELPLSPNQTAYLRQIVPVNSFNDAGQDDPQFAGFQIETPDGCREFMAKPNSGVGLCESRTTLLVETQQPIKSSNVDRIIGSDRTNPFRHLFNRPQVNVFRPVPNRHRLQPTNKLQTEYDPEHRELGSDDKEE